MALLGGLWSGAPLAQEAPTPVGVDAVTRSEVAETASVIGRFVARDAGLVAAAVAGPVEQFLVEVGDRLTAGQTLATIDATELEARLALARAQFAQAEGAVATAEADLTLARQELARAEGLKSSAAFSQQRLEDAQARVAFAEASVQVATAAVAARQAELTLAQIDLARATVKAPYDGVVLQTLTEVGSYVNVGDALVEMVGDSALELEADVPFRLLGGLAPGERVSVRLDDGFSLLATLRAIVPSEDPLTRTRRVRFSPELPASHVGLAAGQTATLALPTGPRREALTVHKDAVIPSPAGGLVYIAVERDGRLVAEARQVILGAAVGNRFEVIDGLAEGDRAVIRGNERLRPGQQLALISKGADPG